MNNLAIVQARTGSTRFPGKVLKQINGRSLIEWQILRIKESNIQKIVLATSNERADDELATIVRNLGIQVFRGSLTNVHSRFLSIVQHECPEYFIRLTGDCPLTMPRLINQMISVFESRSADYLSNVNPPTYPDGLDVEIISSKSFLDFSRLDLTEAEREHVTLGMRQRANIFRIDNFSNDRDLSKARWTVDYQEDFNFIEKVFQHFAGRETKFTMNDILQALESGHIVDNKISHEFRNIALKKGS
jgi:spore coat polysaccharide biosynthesis protein SpsF